MKRENTPVPETGDNLNPDYQPGEITAEDVEALKKAIEEEETV